MKMWHIVWESPKGKVLASSHYRSERMYRRYWKYHCSYEHYFADLPSPRSDLVGYDPDGKEIDRYHAVAGTPAPYGDVGPYSKRMREVTHHFSVEPKCPRGNNYTKMDVEYGHYCDAPDCECLEASKKAMAYFNEFLARPV